MADESTQLVATHGYSWQIGFVYVFNIIIGAGVLTLPKPFGEVGWLLGLISLSVLGVFSFITVTFIAEGMSLSNAMFRYQLQQKKLEKKNNGDGGGFVVANPNTDSVVFRPSSDDVKMPENEKKKNLEMADTKQELYDITVKAELGEMAQLFFPKIGVIGYYIIISLYLYGSSAVYGCAIAKSLATVACNDAESFNGNNTKPCLRYPSMTVFDMYRIMLSVFCVVIGPFCYWEIRNTKILQIFTTTYRWFAMSSMIILAFVKIARGEGNHEEKPMFVFAELPNFFGFAVYAFMCQHSIPAVTTPINDKSRLNTILIFDFMATFLFYAVMMMSAVFAFPPVGLQDVYTLNFGNPAFFRYLLQLFPVLTLSATFPVFSIVLRDNIKKLVLKEDKEYGIWISRILFSSIAIIPPIIVAYMTTNVGTLVGYTGTYAGAVVQYVVPAMLVFCGRRKMIDLFGVYENKHRSIFSHAFWVWFVLAWYVICLVFVTYNKIKGN